MEQASQIAHPVTADTLAGVENLAAEAVAAVTQQIYARHPELLQRLGEKGQNACRQACRKARTICKPCSPATGPGR